MSRAVFWLVSDASPGQGCFLVVPHDAVRVPSGPENCVKRVSACQSCVK